MKKWLQKSICIVLVLTMIMGLSACGGKETSNVNAELAKQFVYSYQDIEMENSGDEFSIRAATKYNDRIYMVMEIYHWDSDTQKNDVQLVSMKSDGTDMQMVALEFPQSENADGVDIQAGEAVPYAMEDMARTEVADTEVAEEVADETVVGDMSIGDDYYSQVYEYSGYNNYVLGNNGKIFAVKEYYFEDYSDPENYISYSENYICAWDFEGKFLWQTPMENLQTEEEYSYISKLIPDANDGVIVLVSGDNVGKIEVDAQGNMSERKELPNGRSILANANDILLKEDGTLLVPYYNEEYTEIYLSSYDVNTDTLGEKSKLPASFMMSGYNAMQAGVSTDIVYTTANGVFGLSVGDEQPVQIMSYINSDLNTNTMNQIVMLDEEHFIGFYNDSADYKNKAAIFTKMNPEEIPDKQVIVVAGVYLGWDLKNRIIEFNKTSQEYRVVVKEYDSYNTMEDSNAGATQLNNDIISGNMPDILIANSTLPMDSYISKGLFADIGKLIEQDEELSQIEYLDNVFKAYSVNDTLYYVIPSFIVQTMIGKTANVGDKEGWNMQDFKAYADSLPEGSQMIGEMTQEGFLYLLMRYCGSDFVDVSTGKCNFNSEEFISLLEYAKTMPVELSEDYYGEDYWLTYQSQYRDNRTMLMSLYISSLRDISYNLNGYFGEDVTFVGFPSEDGKGSIISEYDGMYALSAKSQNLEGAWEFIRYYLTDEYQNTMEWGLPVSKEAFMAKAQEGTQRPYYVDENGEKIEYDNYFDINGESVILEPLSQEQVDQCVATIMATDKRAYYNQDIQDIMTEEVAAFFEGQKSAAEVAQIIQSRAQIFVDENR